MRSMAWARLLPQNDVTSWSREPSGLQITTSCTRASRTSSIVSNSAAGAGGVIVFDMLIITNMGGSVIVVNTERMPEKHGDFHQERGKVRRRCTEDPLERSEACMETIPFQRENSYQWEFYWHSEILQSFDSPLLPFSEFQWNLVSFRSASGILTKSGAKSCCLFHREFTRGVFNIPSDADLHLERRSIPMIGPKFPHFTLKTVEYSRYLPVGTR